MKELSIEQKAQRYDEAIKIAKVINNEQRAQPFNVMTRVFPELKESEESEDEKIREELISNLKETIENIRSEEIIPHNAKVLVGKMQKWIAWLEKQGEKDVRQKFLEDLLVADDIYQMSMNEAMVEEARTKAINALSELEISKLLGIEKQGEQKPVDSYFAVKKLYEQKPAWSEEDTFMYNKIKNLLTHISLAPESRNSLFDWLKSIKGRVDCEANCTTMWKPNDEQMKALHDMNLTGNISYAGQGQVLIELYNDLKKLTK